MDQPGKVASPARGQQQENNIFLVPFAPENLVSRDVENPSRSKLIRRRVEMASELGGYRYVRGGTRERPVIAVVQ